MVSTTFEPILVHENELASTSAIFPYDDLRYEHVDVHDPSVVRYGSEYLMFATSGHEFVPLWISKDLKDWKFVGPIQEARPEWLDKAVPQHNSIWAPAPFVIGKKLRVYYCASQKFGSNTSFIGMIENDQFDSSKPTKGWVDKGKLIESEAGKDTFNAIDPDVFADKEGRQWMVYGSYWGGLYQIELDPESGLVKKGAKWFHIASNTGDRGNPLEAPCVRYHGGYYYLYVSYGLAAQGVRSTYRLMVGRSKTSDGPFLGFDGKPMTEGGHTDVLKSSPPMFAPGGGNMFQDKNGEWYFAYHYYDGSRNWHGDVWGRPTLQIRKVVWGSDGWPLPGLPASIELVKSKTKGVSGKWLFQADFLDPAETSFEPNGTMTQGKLKGSYRVDGNSLILSWPRADAPDQPWIDRLTLDETQQFAVGRNQSGVVVRGIKVDAKVRKL